MADQISRRSFLRSAGVTVAGAILECARLLRVLRLPVTVAAK